MIPLSSRASNYLSTLERRPHVTDLERVEKALEVAGIPVRAWLIELHAQFAGYVQRMGLDEAVYGVLHDPAEWLGPDGIDYEIESEDWGVACADAHPSYDFWVFSDHHFSGIGGGGSADSFARKVERDAVLWEFTNRGKALVVHPREPRDQHEFLAAVRRVVAPHCVDEASDRFTTVYLVEGLLVWRGPEVGWPSSGVLLLDGGGDTPIDQIPHRLSVNPYE